MFLGQYTAVRGYDKRHKKLSMSIPTMDENTRLLDIEEAIIEDRTLKWGFHNTKLIGKMLGLEDEISIVAMCKLPKARTAYIAPSVVTEVNLNRPISISDMSYFVKHTIEEAIAVYNTGDFGYVDIRVTIKTAANK